MPEAYKLEPTLEPHLEEYLDAFYILSTSRAMGFEQVGYIPLTEIESFCRMFPVLDVPLMVEIIRHLDRIFIDFQSEKLKATSNKK